MSSVIVYAAPYVPPAPPVVPWHGFGLTWTGWDGSEWDLQSPEAGVVALADGIVGLHLPSFEPHTTPRRSGRSRRGARVKERSIELPLLVWSDKGSEEWLARDRALWHSFHPLRAGTLAVSSPDGPTRTIRAYLESGGDHAYPIDPAKAGWALYQLVLTAEKPFWLDETFEPQSWGSVDAGLFFGGGDPENPAAVELAPPLFISNYSSVEDATIRNPGDVPAWPRWEIRALDGSVDVDITVGNGKIGIPTIPEGQIVRIDTDPTVVTATMGTTKIGGLLDPYDPRPIDDVYDESALKIEMTGAGIVTLYLTPRYFKAW